MDILPHILSEIPTLYRGPGGAVAVLKDGQVIGQQTWGYADLEKRIPVTADTIFPICSISKQFTCALLVDLEKNPTPTMLARNQDASEQFNDAFKDLLHPSILKQHPELTIQHLANMQSGLRDYWALTVLWGARPEDKFSIKDHGPKALERIRSFHFEPGTQYSYSNINFFLLGRIIEIVSGQELADLLEERIFKAMGMKTACLCADTYTHPGDCEGYEGDEEKGYYPAENRIEWAGDAGIVCSLSDMIAYETHLDQSIQSSPESWYAKNSTQQFFKNGAKADYGNGLARASKGGIEVLAHGGGLRGYRLSRFYAAERRFSIVVLLNSEFGDPGGINGFIIKKMEGSEETKREAVEAGDGWIGTFLDDESKLAIVVSKATEKGEIMVKYHRKGEKMRIVEPFKVQSDDMTVTLDGDILKLDVPKDNRKITAKRVPVAKPEEVDSSGLHGDYYCEEIDSVFHCNGSGGMVYGAFDGFLGKGPMHFMRPLAEDLWALACPRAMDSTPPGDWTVVVKRNKGGNVCGVTIGCWLARNLEFVKREKKDLPLR